MADDKTRREGISVLERGDIYFLYRPKVERDDVRGFGDVQRMFMVLGPDGSDRYRLVTVGRKRMPEVEGGGERFWGFVDLIAKADELREELGREVYQTKTRGEREQPEARPAAEGRYAIVRHQDHTHLMYELELPRRPGEVQKDLNISPEASYILSIKNPEAPSPPQADLSEEREADFPKRLQERLGDRKFGIADPPDFLDHEGAEVLLVGVRDEANDEMGLDLNVEKESEATAEVFNELRLERSEKARKPLFKGEWA